MTFLTPTYDLRVVAASFFIASFASFVALDLASRVAARDRGVARRWWASGSLAMGTGIWSMHFVGMLAYTLTIPLGYTAALTFLSWLAGVGVSATALGVASLRNMRWLHVAAGALAMAIGIAVMHYAGMAAMDMAPGIVWNRALVLASVAIALVASTIALVVMHWFRRAERKRSLQFAAAVVLGAAICAIHWTGMFAAGFPQGAICLSANALHGESLGMLVSVSSMLLLTLTLYTSAVDARMESRTVRLAASLKTANDELQAANEALRQRALSDPLTGLPNRVLFEDRLAQACKRHDRAAAAARKAGGASDVPRFAVLFVDLDGFKPVNDVLGHAAGDQVLQEAARRLRVTGRDHDTDLELRGGQLAQVDQARVAGAEVVDRDEHADAREAVEHALQRVGVAHRHRFGHLAQQLRRIEGVALERGLDAGDQVVLAQLVHRQVDRHARAHALLGPLVQLAADLVDHPVADLVDQAEALGDRDEHHGADVAAFGMVPAQQRLDAADLAGVRVDLGLVVQLELAPLDGHAQLAVQVQALAVGLVHARLEHRAGVAAGALGGVHRGVGAHDELLALAVLGVHHHADRRRHVHAAAVHLERARQPLDEAVGQRGRIADAAQALGQQQELVAADARDDRSFINDIETSKDALAIVSAVVNLAHALGLKVVAEGVETAGQRDILIGMNCDEMQGFYFARPMAAESLHDWFLGNKPDGAVDFSPSAMLEHIPT